MRYHLTPTRIAIIKKSTHNECWKVWRKWNSPTLLVGMCVGAAIMEDIMEITQKTKNRVAIQSINSTPGRISRQNSNSKSYMHHYVHSNTIHYSKTGKNLCSLAEEWRQMFHTHPYIWNITGIYIIYMWNITEQQNITQP